MNNPETILQRNVMLALNRTGLVRLVRNRIGLDQHGRFGLGDGSPDLVGVLRSGKAWCLEVKYKAGKERATQKAWWKAACLFSIGGGTVRSVEEAIELLGREAARGPLPSLEPGHERLGT